jgi:ribosomal protein S18 acetylase RimI-like enzyme
MACGAASCTIAREARAGRLKQTSTIRRATAEDYPAFERLFPELQVDDPVPDRGRWERDIAPYAWMAEQNGAVVGYCFCQEYQDSGYVRHVVVTADVRGQGIGRALMERLSEHLFATGARRWRLNVLPENLPALRLYKSLGMRTRYKSTSLRLSWSIAKTLPRDPSATRIQPLPAESEARIESQFDLPRGQLSGMRRPGVDLIELVEAAGDETLGFAVFDAKFPGAFPFRVKRPELAAPLLQGLRTHADPAEDLVYLVVEDDAALAELLTKAGATIRHEILHLDGLLKGESTRVG